jgi:SRSO17 transposase
MFNCAGASDMTTSLARRRLVQYPPRPASAAEDAPEPCLADERAADYRGLAAADLSTAVAVRKAGDGSKGPRFYDWAWLTDVGADGEPDDGRHSLLIRRNNTTGELAFYRCWTTGPATLAQLVRVAGVRWIVEESFQAGKGQVGLDQHQVRRWPSWHRFTPSPWPRWEFSRSAPPMPAPETVTLDPTRST